MVDPVRSKILAKVKIYILSRAELLSSLCYEISCKPPAASVSKSYTGNDSFECHPEIHVENGVNDRVQC